MKDEKTPEPTASDLNAIVMGVWVLKDCKECAGYGWKYHKPKGYTGGGHHYKCFKCSGDGYVATLKSHNAAN